MNCRVFYHNNCFDGACSASIFTRFHRECIRTATEFTYHGLMHRAGSLFDESEFSGNENAIVDFKYSASPRLTWWFDHHLSAFLTPEDQQHFQQELQAQEDGLRPFTKFFDPTYTSCTSFIADIAHSRFGFDISALKDLIYWANIVDGAKYESAESAVGMKDAAMQLTLVIESTSDSTFIPRLIPYLTEMPLDQILQLDFVAPLLEPLLEKHRQSIDLIRSRATCDRGTITFDITDQPTEGYNKFIPYYLFPHCNYNIGLSKSSFRTKVAVGTNPWTKLPVENLANLAAICERYGGGGHARVGAISFPPDREEDARKAAAEIIEELRTRYS